MNGFNRHFAVTYALLQPCRNTKKRMYNRRYGSIAQKAKTLQHEYAYLLTSSMI
jgi:hypothetical protein